MKRLIGAVLVLLFGFAGILVVIPIVILVVIIGLTLGLGGGLIGILTAVLLGIMGLLLALAGGLLGRGRLFYSLACRRRLIHVCRMRPRMF